MGKVIERGVRPKNTFKFPLAEEAVAKLRASYKSQSKITLRKEKQDFTWRPNPEHPQDGSGCPYIISCTISEAETLLFANDIKVLVQVRGVTNAGEPFKSKIYNAMTDHLLDEKEL